MPSPSPSPESPYPNEQLTWTPALEQDIRHYARSVAKRVGLHPQDYLDAESVACFSAYRSLSRYGTAARKPVLLTCAHNAVTDLVRSARRKKNNALPLFEWGAVDEMAEQRLIDSVGLEQDLERLSSQQRQCVALLMGGMTQKQCMERLLIPLGEWKAWYAELKEELAGILGLDEGGTRRNVLD